MSTINFYKHIIKGAVLFILLLLISGTAISQTKVGYIDSKKIIDNMQEAKDAKTKLDNLVTDWQKEMTVLQDSVKKMKEDYDKKKLILTEQMKTDLEKKIKDVEDVVVNFRSQKFGDNGEYSQKQIEFMRPVYDKIFKAIEIVAKQDDFDYVFDRSGDFLLLFVNEKYDLTGKVQRVLEGKK